MIGQAARATCARSGLSGSAARTTIRSVTVTPAPVPGAAEAWTCSSWPPAPCRAGEGRNPPPAGTDSDF
jgi:hypothetical protein